MSERILLVHPAFRETNNLFPNFRRVESIEPPPGLAYLIAPLRRTGMEIDFIDHNVDKVSIEEFNQKARKSDFIGISCYSESFHNAIETIKFSRTANPKAKILCGGPLCRLTEEYVDGSDVTVAGEAEHLIVDLVQKLSNNELPFNLPGMRFKSNDVLISTPGSPRVFGDQMNVGSSVYEAKNFLAQGRDYGSFMGFKVKGLSGFMTSRGCPFVCKFCAHRGKMEIDKKIRYRNIDDVVSELGFHSENGGQWAILYDENATASPRRSKELMQALIDEKVNLKIVLQSRATSADDELYKLERRAGVKLKMFGIESANQDVLDFYDKRATVEQMENAIKLADRNNMLAFGYFILGSPIETRDHFLRNLDFVDSVPLSSININVLGYYPGSILHAEAIEKGLVKRGETKYADENNSHYTFSEWNRMKEQMIKHFYSPRRIAGNLMRATRAGILPTVFNLFLKAGSTFIEKAAHPFYDGELDRKNN